MRRNLYRGIVILFIGITSITCYAQQQGQYSQYMMNYFLVNPGVAGTEDYVDIRAGYRMQWLGVSGGPRNYYISAHAPINKRHDKVRGRKKEDPYHVVGGMFSGQTLGALRHSTGYLTYAYHLPLTTKLVMSMGAVGGINQFNIDQDYLNWGDDVVDPSVTAGNNSLKFDMGLGIWIYTPSLFLGVSSMQVLGSDVDFSSLVPGSGALDRHYYLTGGYKIAVNEDLKVIPSLMFRGTTSAYQMDINTKVRYRDLFWGGMSYRRTDAMVLLAGMGIPLSKSRKGSGYNGNGHGNNSRIEIGYSYDITTSRLSKYSSGSHEIMVAVVFPIQGRLICPSDYW